MEWSHTKAEKVANKLPISSLNSVHILSSLGKRKADSDWGENIPGSDTEYQKSLVALRAA